MTKFLVNRAINLLQAETDWILRKVGIKHFKHFPTFLSIEPANYCQLRCPECPVGQAGRERHQHALMPMTLYRKLLQESCLWIHTIQFFFQGEPLLNPQLPDMIREARKRHIYTIVSTNAQSLTRTLAHDLIAAGLNRIIVSLDGLTEESYTAYRKGGSLQRALEGLKYLREAKTELQQSTTIELQCLLLKSNEHEWNLFRRDYKKMGADRLTFKTAQFYDYTNGNPLMPSDSAYCRYTLGNDGKYHPRNRLQKNKSICRRLMTGCVINANGDVLPCCFDKNEQYRFGNIAEQSLKDCWQSKVAEHFRETVFSNSYPFPICQNCTE